MIGRLWLLACGQVRVRVTGASDAVSQPVRGAGYHAAADGPHGME